MPANQVEDVNQEICEWNQNQTVKLSFHEGRAFRESLDGNV